MTGIVYFFLTVAKWHGLWRNSFRVNDKAIMLSYHLPSVCQIPVNLRTFACFELNLYSKSGLERSI